MNTQIYLPPFLPSFPAIAQSTRMLPYATLTHVRRSPRSPSGWVALVEFSNLYEMRKYALRWGIACRHPVTIRRNVISIPVEDHTEVTAW